MEKTTLYLSEDLQKELAQTARREQRSQADVVREALAQYFSRQSPPSLRSLGLGEDAELSAAQSKAWVKNAWDAETK